MASAPMVALPSAEASTVFDMPSAGKMA